MLRLLVALFIIVPALEIWGIIAVGHWIGGLQTLALLLLSGFLGAYLAKREGSRVWRTAQEQLNRGQLPAVAILDGVCVFAGGVLLMSPGFITDILGLVLLLPITRPFVRWALLWLLKRQYDKGRIRFRRW